MKMMQKHIFSNGKKQKREGTQLTDPCAELELVEVLPTPDQEGTSQEGTGDMYCRIRKILLFMHLRLAPLSPPRMMC